ncbi:histone deacetylase protein, partial [Aphelenchoides avenae]
HGDCVRFFRHYDIPLLLLGGGGYTPANVARCWAYETAIALDKDDDINEDLPYNPYFEEFAPQYQLHFRAPKDEDPNSRDYLHDIKMEVFENLRHLSAAPGVQMQPVSEEYMLHQLKKVGVRNPRKWLPVVHVEKMPDDVVKLYEQNGHANGHAANGHSSSKKRRIRSEDEPGPSKDLGSDDEAEVSRSEKDDGSERRSSWSDLFQITPFQFLWRSSSS